MLGNGSFLSSAAGFFIFRSAVLLIYQKQPGSKRLVLNKGNIKKIQLYFKNLLYTYPDVLSVNQVSEVTGYSTTTILKWVNKGMLKCFNMGNRYVVPKICLLEFLSGPDFMQTLVHSKYEKERLMKYLNDFE